MGDTSQHSPLKIDSTVRKYMPMGATIMAAVKPRSLKITSLPA
jgi:hypothetical protein